MAEVYEIRIGEYQRLHILKALRMFNAEFPGHFESELLQRRFEWLPNDEKEAPGCTHGFAF